MARGSPLQAIKAKCLDCCCHNAKEVESCIIADCPLYPYREGKEPEKRGLKKVAH